MFSRQVILDGVLVAEIFSEVDFTESEWQAREAVYLNSITDTLPEMIEKKVAAFEQATRDYLDKHYDLRDTDGIIAKLVLQGVVMGDQEVIPALAPAFIWGQAVVDYNVNLIAQMRACTTKAQLNALSWDLEQFDATDPMVTL